jgi:hypothetical protein
LVLPAVAGAQRGGSTRRASVTYLGGGAVFIDAGSMEGLRQGSNLDVLRRGRTVAVLRVETLDAHQATCTVVSRQVPLMVGDSVRFTPVALPITRPPVVATRPPVPAPVPAPRAASAPRDSSTALAPARPADSAVSASKPRLAASPRQDSASVVRFVSPRLARPPLALVPAGDVTESRQDGAASVTYLGRDWLFIDAGSEDGLRQGSEVEVVRHDRTVAVLRVESLGSHQANCSVVSHQLTPILGDSVRFTPVTLVAAPPVTRAADSVAAPVTARAPEQPRVAVAPPRSAAAAPGTATVTFVSGAEIYVGAGRQAGLVEGAELSVIRRDSTVATLRVKFVSSRQSSCEVVRGAKDVAVGDLVRFVPQVAPAGTSVAAATARRHHPRRLSGPGLHGRVGMRYLRATSNTDSSGTATGSTGFNQPSFDLRMNGLSIEGTAIGLSVDLRTRRTVTSSTGQANRVDGKTRVYQAAVFWGAPGAPFRTVAGRQYLTAITSVGMVDGGLVEINRPRLSVGVFGGLEPDAASLGFSQDIQDHGGYVQVHNRPGSPRSWSFTTGGVRSFEAGAANREFGFVQANASSTHFSFFGLQEVDYYPSWKVQLGEKEFSFTSQYASGLIRPSRWLSFNGSYDKRRNVRLYRDTQNPETAFDDAYRQGYGGGVQISSRKVHVGGDWRRSTGGTAGSADSYTGTLGLDQFTRLNVGFSARATWYQNQNDSTANNPGARRTSGQLYSGQLGLDPVSLLHIDVNGGLRREDNPATAALQTSTWFGLDIDASMARAWFVSFSALRQKDPANPGTSTTTQLYASATWRF